MVTNDAQDSPIEGKVYDLDTDTEILTSPPKHVLLLEDEGTMALPLIDYLQHDNFQVTLAVTGTEGLKEVMARDFDVIVCDMVMPNLAGDAFYLAVQRTKPHLCRRFIFMTGHTGDPKWADFIRKIGGVMLWKPFPFHDLKQKMKQILVETARQPTSAAPASPQPGKAREAT